MIINTKLDLFKYKAPPEKSELTDKEMESFLVASPTKKQHEIALNLGKKIVKPRGDTVAQLTALKEWSQNPAAYEKKLADKKLIKWALEESPVPIVKNPYLKKAIAAQQDAKQPKKIKPTEPVKIDFDLTPMHTASLMSNIRDSSIYKLLKNPKVIGVELGHDGIMEVINILQSSGLLKEGGIVK